MRQAVARSAALRVSSLAVAVVVVATVIADAAVVAAAAMAIAKLARCIAPHAQAVAKKRRYLFSREKTDPSIAAIATSHKARAARITIAGLAGSPGDRNFGASRRFV